MSSSVLLAYYCLFILLASIVGGMIPVWFRLTHRWMEFAVSFVAGVMLGIGVLHMLPHAVETAVRVGSASGAADHTITFTMLWLLAGMLAMFFIERFFCYHHHDVPDAALEPVSVRDKHDSNRHIHAYGDHDHDLSWSGAMLGLSIHSVLAGVALAASVQHGSHTASLAGFGTFLVIVLHKPFDSMTIGTLMARGGWSLGWRHTVNALFSLAIPVGVLVFFFGLMPESADSPTSMGRLFVAYALAFSAGTFLCISLSDLLPELQFHQHDRIKLSAALLAGIGVAMLAGQLETTFGGAHSHEGGVSTAPVGRSESPVQ